MPVARLNPNNWSLPTVSLCVLMGCLLLTGCPWQSYVQKHSGLPPVAFQGKPSLEELMSAVNTTQMVKQLQSQGAKISVAGAPTLKAQFIVEQPKKFRLDSQPGYLISPLLKLILVATNSWPGYGSSNKQIRRSFLSATISWLQLPLGIISQST